MPILLGLGVTFGLLALYMSKAFGLVMDMEKMIGKDFDSGLAAMRDAAKKG